MIKFTSTKLDNNNNLLNSLFYLFLVHWFITRYGRITRLTRNDQIIIIIIIIIYAYQSLHLQLYIDNISLFSSFT